MEQTRIIDCAPLYSLPTAGPSTRRLAFHQSLSADGRGRPSLPAATACPWRFGSTVAVSFDPSLRQITQQRGFLVPDASSYDLARRDPPAEALAPQHPGMQVEQPRRIVVEQFPQRPLPRCPVLPLGLTADPAHVSWQGFFSPRPCPLRLNPRGPGVARLELASARARLRSLPGPLHPPWLGPLTRSCPHHIHLRRRLKILVATFHAEHGDNADIPPRASPRRRPWRAPVLLFGGLDRTIRESLFASPCRRCSCR